MIGPMLHRTALLTLLSISASAAGAQQWELVCNMNDYSGGKLQGVHVTQADRSALNIRDLIPENAVHIVDGVSAHIHGRDQYGALSRNGRQWVLKYETWLPTLGAAKITYTYIMGTGQISATVLFTKHQNTVRIDRISGTCTRRG